MKAIFIIYLLILVVSSSCTSEFSRFSLDGKYSFVVENDIVIEHPKFSFEYPKSFGLIPLHLLGSAPEITEVMLTREEQGHLSKSHIIIGVFQGEPEEFH